MPSDGFDMASPEWRALDEGVPSASLCASSHHNPLLHYHSDSYMATTFVPVCIRCLHSRIHITPTFDLEPRELTRGQDQGDASPRRRRKVSICRQATKQGEQGKGNVNTMK